MIPIKLITEIKKLINQFIAILINLEIGITQIIESLLTS